MHYNESSGRPQTKRHDGEAMYAMHHPKWTKNQHYGVHEITEEASYRKCYHVDAHRNDAYVSSSIGTTIFNMV